MATAEEFTFPTTTGPPPYFIESPPLWNRHEKEVPKGDDEVGESFSREKLEINMQRKSFSYVERDCEDDREEEKMDMLWEDFNEELSKVQGSRMKISDLLPGRVTGLPRGAMVSGKKPPSVVVFVKVLKKVFLFYNSHNRTVKK